MYNLVRFNVVGPSAVFFPVGNVITKPPAEAPHRRVLLVLAAAGALTGCIVALDCRITRIKSQISCHSVKFVQMLLEHCELAGKPFNWAGAQLIHAIPGERSAVHLAE